TTKPSGTTESGDDPPPPDPPEPPLSDGVGLLNVDDEPPIGDDDVTPPVDGNDGRVKGGAAFTCTLPAARPIVSMCVAFNASTIACGDEKGIGPTPWLGSDSMGIALRMFDRTGSVEPL